MHTNIFDALSLAQRVFATYHRDRKVLVIFSDMIEESAQYNFRRKPPDITQTARIIKRQQAAGNLPDLNGVEVYVVGAGEGTYSNLPSSQIRAVEEFWLKYFKACGADLRKERYGSALLEAPH